MYLTLFCTKVRDGVVIRASKELAQDKSQSM